MSAAQVIEAPLSAIQMLIQTQLLPLAATIDSEGVYPQAFLRGLGRLGGFGAPVFNLEKQIDITTQVGSACGSTAFVVWCQFTCAWYLQHAPESAVRQRYLERVARGELLAGTGMSNAVKHLDGIEKIRLVARRDGAGYVVDGVLPWVSNMGSDHLLIVAAVVEDGGYLMFAVEAGIAGLELHPCPAFAGMEGSRTLNVRFKNVTVGAGSVLAHPTQFVQYMERIKAGFVLGQVGMGFGVVEGCLKTLRESNASHAHVNGFLADQEADVQFELQALQAQAARLAQQAQDGPSPLLPVLKLRAAASELALRAAQSAVLHAGARGYLMRHPAQRQLREAVFVAIVTPALKHLRRQIHDLEHAHQRTEAA
ncbi:MAG: acyl-CoA dehydrogenase family protein [Rhodanobacter sp.]